MKTQKQLLKEILESFGKNIHTLEEEYEQWENAQLEEFDRYEQEPDHAGYIN